MASEGDQDKDPKHNVFAFNEDREEVYVGDVESGERGYYCMGCGSILQAVKSDLPNRIPYFRHSPKDVQRARFCTFSDETYRHKLAKQFLQFMKQVKVPSIHLPPPRGVDGRVRLLSKAHFVDAFEVRLEQGFYENDAGEIKMYGKGTEPEGCNLLLRPDVTFLDRKGIPILFIELVATNKVNDEKKAKLRRLGINAVQVSIPKKSEQDIKNALTTSTRTKWIYNYDAERTDYFSLPESDPGEVSPPDEYQGRFLEETFRCRQAEIRGLIRSITRCLGSEPYQRVEEAIGRELSRVEDNSNRNRKRLRELQDHHRRGIEERYSEQMAEIENAEAEFQAYRDDLEGRYKRKRSELDGEEESVDRRLSEMELARKGNARTMDERIEEVIREQREVEWDIQRAEERIGRIREDMRDIRREFRELEAAEGRELKRIDKETEGLGKEFRSKLETASAKEEKEIQRIGDKEVELEAKFERLGESTLRDLQEENFEGRSELKRKHKAVANELLLWSNDPEVQSDNQRLRTAKKILDSGTYKHWIKP